MYERYKIRESYHDIETHEVFLDTLAHQKEEELGLSEKKFEVRIKERVIYAIFSLFFLCTAALFSKVLYLQAVEGQKFQAIAESNKGKISFIRSERGIIYDKHFTKLVLNAPAYDLLCTKWNVSDGEGFFRQELKLASEILGKNVQDFEKEIGDPNEVQMVIGDNIEQEKLRVLEARMAELPDCQIEKNTVREYVKGLMFSHVLGHNGRISKEELRNTQGYTLSDYIGKNGLEKSYESYLRGIPGRMEVIKSAQGSYRGDRVIAEPQDGYNLVLNIDAELQKTAYEALKKSIKNAGAKKGAAVALDPRNGAVLALVSYPAYDNNIFSKEISKDQLSALNNDPLHPFFNRAISAQYPTGSTIKPFIAAGVLQENLISPAALINDPGYIIVHNQYDPKVTYRFAGVKPHGLVDMRRALAVSSNVYFYTVGGGYGSQQGLGPGRIKKYLGLFSWEQKTGIDLPGEFKGFVPSPSWKKQAKKENWWDGDTYNLSIGQSDLQVTPLQVAVAYSALANGGTLYKPQVVQKVVSGSASQPSVIQEFKPEAINSNFIDRANIEVVRQGMRDGVQKLYGSSYMLNALPVAVAGKTGTAETNKAGVYNTWSSNFAPYENPEIVFVTTIEGVQGLRTATLPVAYDVLKYYFSKK